MSSTDTLPSVSTDLVGRHKRDRSPRTSRAARVALAAGLIALTVYLVVHQTLARSAEAWLAAAWLDPFFTGDVTSSGDLYLVWTNPNSLLAFRITAECTALILLAPLLVAGGLLLLNRHTHLGRGLAGIAAMVVTVLAVNQLRLLVIAGATKFWGVDPGYEISHKFIGSVLGIVGFAIGAAVMLLAMGLRRRK